MNCSAPSSPSCSCPAPRSPPVIASKPTPLTCRCFPATVLSSGNTIAIAPLSLNHAIGYYSIITLTILTSIYKAVSSLPAKQLIKCQWSFPHFLKSFSSYLIHFWLSVAKPNLLVSIHFYKLFIFSSVLGVFLANKFRFPTVSLFWAIYLLLQETTY